MKNWKTEKNKKIKKYIGDDNTSPIFFNVSKIKPESTNDYPRTSEPAWWLWSSISICAWCCVVNYVFCLFWFSVDINIFEQDIKSDDGKCQADNGVRTAHFSTHATIIFIVIAVATTVTVIVTAATALLIFNIHCSLVRIHRLFHMDNITQLTFNFLWLDILMKYMIKIPNYWTNVSYKKIHRPVYFLILIIILNRLKNLRYYKL